MEQLKKRLQQELHQSMDNKVLSELTWAITAQKVRVSYKTVTKTKMDVLMKMILMTLRQLSIERPEELAQVLGVELLFVEDLLFLMRSGGLVESEGVWSVTELGISQLNNGMLVHESEIEEKILIVSPFHNDFMDVDNFHSYAESLDAFRYEEDSNHWTPTDLPADSVLTHLSASLEQENTSERQRVVEQVLNVEQVERISVPCFEFHIHDVRKDTLYVRIWNTYIEQWDEKLEQLVMSKERVSLRQRYLNKKEEIVHET